MQILLSVFAVLYTYLVLIYEYKDNITLSPLFEPLDKTKLNYNGYVDNKIYLELISPNKLKNEKELFYKYLRIVQKVTTIKEGLYHDNTIIPDTFNSKSKALISEKDFSYPNEDKFPSIEISSCYDLVMRQATVQNPHMLKNCSTNLTEFYSSSDEFDRNAYWSLLIDTRIRNILTWGEYEKTFFLKFKPFENRTEEYNLNYVPVEISKEWRTIRLDSFHSSKSKTFRAKIEELVLIKTLWSGVGYKTNVKFLAETSYPYKIIIESSYITIIEALSRLGGFLKIISYIRYLYFFQSYDYDKFHFDLLSRHYERKKIREEKFNKNFADLNHEVKLTDISVDEIDKKAKSLEIKILQTLKSPDEKGVICLKDKMEISKSKTRYSLNKIESDSIAHLIPILHRKEEKNHNEINLDYLNLDVWQWL